MIPLFRASLLGLLLSACLPPGEVDVEPTDPDEVELTEPTAPDDTATDTSKTETGDSGTAPVEPARIVETRVECDADDENVLLEMVVDYPIRRAFHFMADTANDPFGQETELLPVSPDADGASTLLQRELVAGAGPPLIRNENTFYGCVGAFEWPKPRMTYVFAALDERDTVLDCVAMGHNPTGIVEGTETLESYDVNPSFDTTDCRIVEE